MFHRPETRGFDKKEAYEVMVCAKQTAAADIEVQQTR